MWRPSYWSEIRFQRCVDLTKGGGTHSDVYEVFDAGADEGVKAVLDKIEQLASPRGACHYHSLEKFIQSPHWKKLREGK